MGGLSAKVGSSAKFDVVVFKESILNSLGGPSAKVGSSVKFGVAVFKASILDSPEVLLAKVGLSAKFGVAVFKASILDSLWGVHQPKKVHLPNMNTLLNLLLLHRGLFILHTKDQ